MWGSSVGLGREAGGQKTKPTRQNMPKSYFLFQAVNEADHKWEGRRQAAHTGEGHREVADTREEDKFGKRQAWERNTCKQSLGMGAVPPLSAGSISQGGTDRKKGEEEQQHKWAVPGARKSSARVRRDWGEACTRRRTMARPRQQQSLE